MANNHTAGAAARTFALSELCQRMLAKTSKGTCGPCILYLEDGTIFYGRACGAEGTATGEVCFNTSLEGYFEVMTDPSYAGQIVTMTYPQIGNYGIDETDVQSAFPGDAVRPASAPAMRGMIVRDMCATPSNWRSAVSVPEYLRARGIVAIEGVDTRALVRHLREARHSGGAGPRRLRPHGRAVGYARPAGARDESRWRLFVQRPRRPRRRGGDLRAGTAADRQGAGLWYLSWSPDDQPGLRRPNGKA